MKNFVLTGATADGAKGLVNILAKNPDNKLVLISRSKSEALEKLSESKNILYFSGIDLRGFDRQTDVINKIDNFFHSEFALIHFAGDFWEHPAFLDTPVDKAKVMMDSQYLTLYSTCYALIPIMQKKGGGRIVALGDNATHHHLPHMTSFTAAKAAVEATIKCIAHEFAKDNIIANVLAISSLKTPKNKKIKPYGDYDNYIGLDELGQALTDIVNLPKIINGTTFKAFEYSDSYFNEGYFQRINQTI